MSSRVVAWLPNAGLANKLFVWARACVFSRLNALPMETVGWSYPKLGPLLRGEPSSRMYARYFRRTNGIAWPRLGMEVAGGRTLTEPPCRKLDRVERKTTYVFRRLPHWSDLFADIRDHRDELREALLDYVRPQYVGLADQAGRPVVSLHVRRGDFRKLAPNEDFKRVGGVRTPDDYFGDIVAGIRGVAGPDVPITIFSDGTDSDLGFLLRLPGVARAERRNDVTDLLTLSRAKVIVTSAGSTYGEWAAFLSDGIVLRHPDHIHAPIRPERVRKIAYEGPPPRTADEWTAAWERWAPIIGGPSGKA